MGDTWPARKADLLLAGQGLPVVICSCCGTQEQQGCFSSQLHQGTTTDLGLSHVCTDPGCIACQ